MAFDLR